MGPVSKTPKSYYPTILLLHKELGPTQAWHESMTAIIVNPPLKNWASRTDMFPQRGEKIWKIAPSNFGSRHGWYMLYETEGWGKGLWSTFAEQNPTSNNRGSFKQKDMYLQQDFSDVTTIGTVLDGDSWGQGLIISDSNGLWCGMQLNDTQWWSQVSYDSNLKSCRNLQGTHHGNGELSIWFRNSFDEVGYISCNSNGKGEIEPTIAPPTLLLPASDSVCAEPLALGEHIGHNWQSVVIADYNGSLTHLQQASDTGYWHQKPLYIHHDEGMHEVDSYTINIRPLQEDQSPLIKGLVQIRSSSAVTCYLNGRNAALSPTPQWYETDFEGTLNFIIPTTSMACPTLTITELKSHTKTRIPVRPTVIDPYKKVGNRLDQKFDSIGSWEGLKDLKTQSGKNMFDQNDMPHDDELKDGFDHLQTLRDAHKKLSQDSNSTSFYAADGSFIPPPGSIFDAIAAGWHYIVRVAHKVEHWAVKTVGNVLKFVAKIGEKAFEFILNTAENIMHAATWVWNKLKATIKSLIDLVGHIFSWSDICNTKNTISALITASIDLLAEKAGDAGDSLIDKLDGTAKHLREGTQPKSVDANLFSPNGSDKSLDWLSCNTSVMWAGERLKNGGMANTSRDDAGSLPVHPELTKCWKNTLPHVQKIQPHINKLASSFSGKWKNKSSVSSAEALEPVPDFADNCLDALKSIAAGFLHGIQFVLEHITKYGNAKISIPVISGLYKSLVGHDLTVFDAISLIIGIVTNTITTIITGSPPPIIAGLEKSDNPTQYESGMPGSRMSDRLIDILVGSHKVDPEVLKAFKTVVSGLLVAISVFDRIIGTCKWLKRISSEGLAEKPNIGFEDCFEAICQGICTVASFPTDSKMPAFDVREVICCFDLIKNIAHIYAVCMSSVKELTEVMSVDLFVVLIDTGVSVITSGLGIIAGALELGDTSWKDYNVAVSTAGIVKCVISATGSIAYFLVYLEPTDLEVSLPSALVWQATSAGKVWLECFKWTVERREA